MRAGTRAKLVSVTSETHARFNRELGELDLGKDVCLLFS